MSSKDQMKCHSSGDMYLQKTILQTLLHGLEDASPVVQMFQFFWKSGQDSEIGLLIRAQSQYLNILGLDTSTTSVVTAVGALMHIVHSFKKGRDNAIQKCEIHQFSTPPIVDVLDQSKAVNCSTGLW